MAIVSPSPVTLKYSYDSNVVFNDKLFYTTDRFYFVLSDLLSGARDVAANQEDLLVLTENLSLHSKLGDFASVDKTSFITKCTVSLVSGTQTIYLSAGSSSGPIGYTDQASAATFFDLDYVTYPNYIALTANGLYASSSSPGIVNMQTIRGDRNTTQYFGYNLFNDTIVFFTATTAEVLTLSAGFLNKVGFTTSNFTSAQKFKLNRYYYNDLYVKGKSNNVQYVSTPNDLTIQKGTTDLSHNYLITTPYTSFSVTPGSATFNLTPLKNYYSAQGIQTPTLSTRLKSYNKLHTGLNTDGGTDKIYLSYKASEIARTFTKDKDTYFHYPASAVNLNLKNSTLISTGALAGDSPFRSDRVYLKKAGYSKYSNWGDPSVTQNGVLFCSWLSASPTDKSSAWMDRYFNPFYVDVKNVLTTTAFTSAGNNYPNVIWDVPTTQVFTPNSLYVYHRIGDNDNQIVVDTLSSSLTRYFRDWSNPLVNQATGLSAGTLYNFAASAVKVFPGTRDESLDTSISYGVANFTDDELNNNGITLAFYAYNNDWGRIKGSQLVGNYYNGGIGVAKNNTLLTPFATIINPFDSGLRTFNNKLNTLKVTPTTFTNKTFVLKREYDSGYYVVTSNKKILEYDQDDLNTGAHSFTLSGDLINAFLIKKQDVDQIIVATKAGNTILWQSLSSGEVVTSSGSASNFNNCTVDLYSNIVYFNSVSGNGTVDSKNQVFALSGDILVRSLNSATSSMVLSALSAEYVACDHEDNIWLIYGGRNLCKLDNYGNIKWDVYLTDAPTLPTTSAFPRIINFIAELSPSTGDIIHSGLVIDPKTQTVTKVSSLSGSITSTVNLSGGLSNNITAGDTTGYDYQRKYIYTKENSNDLTVKLFARSITGNTGSEKIINLNHEVGKLTPGWHHFAVTLDPNNYLTFYIDGLVAESTLVGNLSGIYRAFNNKNNSDLIIGTASFKKQTLAQYTNDNTGVYQYNGKIADVRFYTQALQQADIKALQKRFILSSFTDLKWSIPTGEREYIEQIERFFLHRLPGAKSNLFNIKIKNSNITNTNLRTIIEKNIIASLNKTIPVHTKLNKIIWE